MFSDYRSFAECEKDFASSGTFSGDTVGYNGGVVKGFMHLIAVADATLTGVTLQYDRNTQSASPYSMTLKAGCQLGGVTAFTISAGSVEVLYFKS